MNKRDMNIANTLVAVVCFVALYGGLFYLIGYMSSINSKLETILKHEQWCPDDRSCISFPPQKVDFSFTKKDDGGKP